MAQINYYKEFIRTDHFIIRRGINLDTIEIFKYAVLPDNRIEYEYVGKNGWERKVIKDGEEWEPWLVLNGRTAGMVIPELLDALLEFGFQPKEKKLTDEEKTAMKYHLEDMRRLVFKDKKV